ncbi:TonB-dependent receptor plug domain-containing protein [Pedobacter sp. N36a]|uniref:carboxypeptidase-like regulatory domain-containing protein n=1 Tax=Pedobacter sp. N36a TaxID=2767996 RepID=UPI00165733B1|nr:carboxypeptidase-like regulatory domain-containing protein [Pedobacter sp. N36a]MBC8988259.1 TonB-dependent receptor plug domain-containing protein [Pedobacter sp. N36a]
MKYSILILLILLNLNAKSQSRLISGTVLSAVNKSPLSGSVISLNSGRQKAITNSMGNFEISVTSEKDTLIISYVGYNTQYLSVGSPIRSTVVVELVEKERQLEEVVVSTGYYQTPKERATGSFAHVNSELINRSTGSTILSRLEGIAPSLQFDKRNLSGESSTAPSLRIRGLSTIESNAQPLIVLDNFPFENDLSSINPNDVESVTILRDAAAASIWGARAANGVIVITTKQGMYNQKNDISFNHNVTFINKPDLFYNQNYLPSSTIMSFEKELFDKGLYTEDPRTVLPAYADLLITYRDGKINADDFAIKVANMQNQDIRKDALENLYQLGINQQYSLNLNGGGMNNRYYVSAGYDKNRAFVRENESDRINLNIQNTFKILKELEITTGIWYTGQRARNNGITLSDLSPSTGIRVSPYAQLKDENGNANALPYKISMAYANQAVKSGLLDWHYRPLDEIALNNNSNSSNELRLNGVLKYSLPGGLSASINYQYIQNKSYNENYYSPGSWHARNLINTYTQQDGTKVIPNGGIMRGSGGSTGLTHSGRFQLNYQKTFFQKHEISALAGTEVRQQITSSKPIAS